MRDPTADLYDHAFVLFALGWYFRLTKDPEVLGWALRTLDFIDTHMRHPDGHGYLTEVPASGYRKQNPHMHLLEAALVNLEVSGDARFLALANEMVTLFCDHFYDGATQTLGEYFDEGWRRATGQMPVVRSSLAITSSGRGSLRDTRRSWDGTCANSCAASSPLRRQTG